MLLGDSPLCIHQGYHGGIQTSVFTLPLRVAGHMSLYAPYNDPMNDDSIQLSPQLANLDAQGAEALGVETLGGQLVWRIGKDDLSDDVVVRLGYASATPRFAHLPRLRSASDQELQAALEAGQINIEWVD